MKIKQMKVYILSFALLGVLGFVPLLTPVAMAAECKNEATTSILTIPPWYSGLCKDGTNEIEVGGNPGDFVGKLVLNILDIAVYIAGYVAAGFIIWGGIKYIIAAGDSGKVASAKTTIQNAAIGLVIAVSAAIIVGFVQSSIT